MGKAKKGKDSYTKALCAVVGEEYVRFNDRGIPHHVVVRAVSGCGRYCRVAQLYTDAYGTPCATSELFLPPAAASASRPEVRT